MQACINPYDGCGIACGIDAGAYVATMAEVEVDTETGDVKVLKMTTAVDAGVIINPQAVEGQLGAVVKK